MAVFKCKMCGAILDIKDNESICTCEYCGSKQTISNSSDEKCKTLLNRGNAFRLRNEFDLAIDCYSHVINDYPEEAEAYWGLCLSKFGIEYVDDPTTGNKVPTCHRTLFNSIFDDEDYKNAIKYADVVAKELYQEQAKEIDTLQKRIISVSQKEEPFDIFICYKEKDDNGERSKESVIAQDVYERLIEKGYRVFFSRITLETRLGFEYEPIIFAALRSAKVMLAMGSKPEHFEAVWVKNEWSRYLDFMKNDKNKYLIPCYIDMDAYDLPDAFQPLQSQDMAKIGYIQDLLHGIDKIFGANKPSIKKQATDITKKSKSESYQLRIENALDNKDYDKAQWYIEEYEKLNDNSAKLPMYKLLLKLDYSSIYELSKSRQLISEEPLFKEALLKADDEYKETLLHLQSTIQNRLDDDVYKDVLEEIKTGNLQEAFEQLKSIKNNKKTRDLREKICQKQYETASQAFSYGRLDEAISIFASLEDYKDSKAKVIECKENIYKEACVNFDHEDYAKAVIKFRLILDYKDSQSKYDYAVIMDSISTTKLTIRENIKYRKKYKLDELLSPLENIDFDGKEKFIKECRELDLKLRKERKRNDAIKISIIAVPLLAIFVIAPSVNGIVQAVRKGKYNDGIALCGQEKFGEAFEKFVSIDYKDSKERANVCYCFYVLQNNPNYEEALLTFKKKGVEARFEYFAGAYPLNYYNDDLHNTEYDGNNLYLSFPDLTEKHSNTYEIKKWELSDKDYVFKDLNQDGNLDDAYAILKFTATVDIIQTEK